MSRARPVALSWLLACACSSPTAVTTARPVHQASDDAAVFTCEEGEGAALFEQRIAPLLATDRPRSCNSCHLSGVDLSLFVRDTPCETMACLVDRGLVDLNDPEQSTVLQWIARADPESALITQAVIDEEYEGFRAWIEQAARCGACGEFTAPCGPPSDEDDCEFDTPEASKWIDPGDCSPRTREALFRSNVYAWRDRCYPCHFDSSELIAPKWIATGPCEVASLTTMHNVLERGLVDYAQPDQSLLLRKPLAEDQGGVEHGGHDKFESKDELAYRDFKAWIDREAQCASQE
ncbi:MAG: hypothetical protein R3A51_09185 [Nannocystaceae bacterium]|nr:hypothetical protein [Myxococcales bacterium]